MTFETKNDQKVIQIEPYQDNLYKLFVSNIQILLIPNSTYHYSMLLLTS